MIVDFQVTDLIFAEKNTGLTRAKKEELDYFLLLEHIFCLAKVKARQYITQS